jgi:hypothetical protein
MLLAELVGTNPEGARADAPDVLRGLPWSDNSCWLDTGVEILSALRSAGADFRPAHNDGLRELVSGLLEIRSDADERMIRDVRRGLWQRAAISSPRDVPMFGYQGHNPLPELARDVGLFQLRKRCSACGDDALRSAPAYVTVHPAPPCATSLDCWLLERGIADVNATRPCRHCSGPVHREFVAYPPALFQDGALDPGEFGQWLQLNSRQTVAAGVTYELVGIALCDGGHFWGYVRYNTVWFLYNGLGAGRRLRHRGNFLAVVSDLRKESARTLTSGSMWVRV